MSRVPVSRIRLLVLATLAAAAACGDRSAADDAGARDATVDSPRAEDASFAFSQSVAELCAGKQRTMVIVGDPAHELHPWNRIYRPADDPELRFSLSVNLTNDGRAISLSISMSRAHYTRYTPDPDWLSLGLTPPLNNELRTGYYPDVGHENTAESASMRLGVAGRGCEDEGEFHLRRFSAWPEPAVGGRIGPLDLTFEHRCRRDPDSVIYGCIVWEGNR